MSFATEVFPAPDYAREVAARVTSSLPARGGVVLTGGTTAEKVYEAFTQTTGWNGLEVLFSDERCVPPDHDASNFKMARSLFLARTTAEIHRMQGELDPAAAARSYHHEVAPAIEAGPALQLLGMGADCHVGAIFPGSPALQASSYCVAVDRPDGLQGLTLSPPALRAARRILMLVTGKGKAEAVRRVLHGDEGPDTCPARLLEAHPDVTFLLDEPAAAHVT